ncbi:cyclophilin-like fold protein [Streptomyces sp. B1I3]|uniref:cyclophilin-like fold protein n=1 Tax=Streptomyces sp. B1I3 TaxID=3042264 RepID=UPI0027D8463B|nr:cyclophilin-like fold protein [Streptomyces sp. B1I3]
MWDNPTVRALLEQLPLTLSFEDLHGEEKVGHLDRELTMDGMPDGDDPKVGDLGYYAPWGNVVLYYGDVGRWDGIARIGRIHGNLSVISDQTGDFTATLEAAK